MAYLIPQMELALGLYSLCNIRNACVHPRSRALRPESMGVHIRQITRARDTTDMYHVG